MSPKKEYQHIYNLYPPEIFLTYANTPLKNNPKGLYKTLREMAKIKYWKEWKPLIKIGINQIIEKDQSIPSLPDNYYDTCSDEMIDKYIEYFMVLSNNISACADREIDIKTGKLSGDECFWRAIREEIFNIKGLQCHECHHQHFLYILTGIATGKEFSEIGGLEPLIENYQHTQFTNFIVKKVSGQPFKEILSSQFRNVWFLPK